MNIYHIASMGAWIEATRNGSYAADSLGSEGFIHCSTEAQVLPVAQNFYKGQRGLVLLVIDTQRLQAPVKWEPSAPPQGVEPSAVFPHVYGAIGLDAIVTCLEFEPNERGEFALPPLLTDDRAGGRA